MTSNALAELHAACFSTPRPWSVSEFQALLALKRTHLVTADTGFALIQVAGPEAELLTIAVHPDHQRKGHGATLLNDAIWAAKTANCTEMFLEVTESNAPAIALVLSR